MPSKREVQSALQQAAFRCLEENKHSFSLPQRTINAARCYGLVKMKHEMPFFSGLLVLPDGLTFKGVPSR